ncbi:hypothetical protein GALL_530190 [mine drainage metagenome]|uniref:Uncharacterized protein n=1 Tax=mine drainage metagenome TaxID=410659 RepID=A0A1J5PPD4_9ZZZZ
MGPWWRICRWTPPARPSIRIWCWPWTRARRSPGSLPTISFRWPPAAWIWWWNAGSAKAGRTQTCWCGWTSRTFPSWTTAASSPNSWRMAVRRSTISPASSISGCSRPSAMRRTLASSRWTWRVQILFHSPWKPCATGCCNRPARSASRMSWSSSSRRSSMAWLRKPGPMCSRDRRHP